MTIKGNQHIFLKYAEKFANDTKTNLLLSGSFRKGNHTDFSDIDLTICSVDIPTIKSFIYGYNTPVYISHTINPPGIIIVIYPDGVALDIEISDIKLPEDASGLNIKQPTTKYTKNTEICKELSFSADASYIVSRLFHRSLIKYLSGKETTGINILHEVEEFLNQSIADNSDFKSMFTSVLEKFNTAYPLDTRYYNLLCNITDYL